MIGGLSWVSTADYYKRLNLLAQERRGGVTSARVVLESVNRQKYVEYVIDQQDEDAACQMLVKSAQSIEKAGANFLIFTCNDVHRFATEVQANINIEILHIAETVAAKIVEQELKNVSLLGVRKTMEGSFYPDILQKHGIQTVVPSSDQRTVVHDRIYDELVKDVFKQSTRNEYIEIINELQEKGAEGCILGCTEIPMLLDTRHTDVPLFSTTAIHCQAAIDLALK